MIDCDILGLGVATVDDLLTVEDFPIPNRKQKVLSKTRQAGGLTATALVTASRLGCRCAYAIALGDGELSAFLRRTFDREGVVTIERSNVPESEPFHSIIITERRTGERSILWDNEKTLPPLANGDGEELLDQCKCLFVDHVFAEDILPLVKKARARGLPVVGDFERTTPDSLSLLELTDHCILPLAYAWQVVGRECEPEEAVTQLAGVNGRTLACVTNGEHGAWYATGDQPDRVYHQPVFPITEMVDSTGCGDVFHGAYAAGLVKGWLPGQRIRYAAAAAAMKARHTGAQAGAPTLEQLEEFIRSCER